MLGRRGPAQAAFTSAELRELGHLDGVEIRVGRDAGRARPRVASVAGRGGHASPPARTWSCCASSRPAEPATGRSRVGSSCASCARRSRSAGPSRVEAIEIRRNEIVRTTTACCGASPVDGRGDDRVRARPALGRLPGGAAARRAVRRARLRPAERARARARSPTASRSPASTPSAGSSAGRPGSSAPTSATPRRRSAASSRTCRAGALPQPPNPDREQIDALLAERKPDLVTADGWRAIDAPRARARPRPSSVRASSWRPATSCSPPPRRRWRRRREKAPARVLER